jgi:hypothetical protein
MEFFKNFKISKPEFNLLSVGEHIVRMIRAEEVTSFQQFNGDDKLKLPEWKDATPQLAITIVAAEDGKSGGLTHRFNGRGYVKMSELSKEQRESGNYEDQEGYACSLNEDGLLVREVSEAHTKECANIINSFALALGATDAEIKKGLKLEPLINRAITDQVKFRVTVVNKPHLGKDQLRLDKFKVFKAETVKADFEE